jgi:hypothetical protein
MSAIKRRKMMKFVGRRAIPAMLAAILGAGSALAHHSFAAFDRSRTITITGTLKAVEWVNPHAWIWVTVPHAGQAPDVYALETGGPLQMIRMGVPYSRFKVGDKITVVLYPIRDGRLGGQPKSYQFADGTLIDVDKAVVKYATGN